MKDASDPELCYTLRSLPGRALLVLLTCLVLPVVAAEVTFTNKVVSFTNLEGKVYEHVSLVKSDREGVIWRSGASGGRVAYTNLHPQVLQRLGVETNGYAGGAAPVGRGQEPRRNRSAPARVVAGKPARWQVVRILSVESNSPSCYKCAADRANPGDPPLPPSILVEHLPAEVITLVDQIEAEQLKVDKQQTRKGNYAMQGISQMQSALAPDPANPAGQPGESPAADAALAQRQVTTLRLSGAEESLERTLAAKDAERFHGRVVAMLRQRLWETKVKLFFTGYLENGIEVWDGAR